MPFDAEPKNWQRVSLREAAGELFTDGDWVESKDQDPNGEVRLIQLADIGDGSFLNKSARFLTAEKARQLRCTLLRPGDLLIARMADPIARCCIYPGLDRPAATVVDVTIIRTGPKVNRDFLSYATSTRAFRSEAVGAASGTTRSRISRANLGSIRFSLPPLDEQRRIAEVLYSLDEAMSRAEAEVSQCRALLASMAGLFVRSATDSMQLGELFDFKNGMNFEVAERGSEGTLTLDVMNMFSGDLKPTYAGAYRITKEVPSEMLIRGGDLLFVRSSVRREGVGWVALADGFNENTTFCGFIIRARPTSKRIESRFAAYILRSSPIRDWLIQHSTRSALTNINQNTLASLSIPVPAPEQQERAVRQLDSVATSASEAASALLRLRSLRERLATELLSGRVRVPA